MTNTPFEQAFSLLKMPFVPGSVRPLEGEFMEGDTGKESDRCKKAKKHRADTRGRHHAHRDQGKQDDQRNVHPDGDAEYASDLVRPFHISKLISLKCSLLLTRPVRVCSPVEEPSTLR